MTKFSFLDLVPLKQGGTLAQSLDEARELARIAERHGFERYWIAEHHNIASVGSAATSLCIQHILAGTERIRVGAGGIMLPNHPPLVIAEQFGTLDAVYPGRVDLGLGRAPGGDGHVIRALRRPQRDEEKGFIDDIRALQSLFADDGQTGVHAFPGGGADVPLYILGSSMFGAYAAAALGLPYAFASHFAPQMLHDALRTYRENFRPSEALAQPYTMMAANMICADSEEEAELLASSQQQSFVALRTGNPGPTPPPVPGYFDSLPPQAQSMLGGVLKYSAVGTPEQVSAKIHEFATQTQVDEVILTGAVYDREARLRSLDMGAAALTREHAAA